MNTTLVQTFGAQIWAILPTALDSISKLISGPGGERNPLALVADNETTWISYLRRVKDTAIITINGPIFYNILYFGTNLQIATRDLETAVADRSIKRIVLHITSPGGVITGVAEFARLVYQARAKKPIIGYAQGMCASAAYWIYSACSVCVTDPTALLGSIGVVFQFEDDSEALERMGYKTYVITSKQSPLKNISPANAEGEKAYQTLADELAAEFIDSVATYRNVSAATVETGFGRGFIMTGDKAVKVGMADETGSMQELLSGTLSLTSIKGQAMAEQAETTTSGQQTGQAAGSETTQTVLQQTTAMNDAGTGHAVTTTGSNGAGPAQPAQPAKPASQNPDAMGSIKDLETKIEQLTEQNGRILDKLEQVLTQNQELKAENETLKAENLKLQDQPDEGDTPKVNGLNDSIERGW